MKLQADKNRRVLLEDPCPRNGLSLLWLHLAHGRRPADAAGVRVLPAYELTSGDASTPVPPARRQ